MHSVSSETHNGKELMHNHGALSETNAISEARSRILEVALIQLNYTHP
jgi:hypothetical protein